MSADETYENIPHHKFNNDNQPILVATDVKNIMLVPDIVNHSKIHPHFRERMPLCLLNGMIPTFKRYHCVLVPGLLVEFFQFSMRNDSHIALLNTKLHKYSANQNFKSAKFQFAEYFKSIHIQRIPKVAEFVEAPGRLRNNQMFCGLQEAEGDADIAETVRLAVVLFKIVAGKFAAPDKVIVAAERQIDLETV